MWRDYFPRGVIAGLDINPVDIQDPSGRIRVYQGRQQDKACLDRIAREVAPDGFDIIIDDASHIGQLTRISFWHLFQNHLKSGGYYVIEDWGTGYWKSWPDGHEYSQITLKSPWSIMEYLAREKLGLKSFEVPFVNGYQKRFPSHDYGMVGVIKEIIDECGMGDITHEQYGTPPFRPSRIKKMHISHGLVIVIKA
ncbi:hypothetical protein [Candidatus Methylocalor cossyra]|uniref:Class I SAM-dependent methyltransferase n=1 Tax=Candidatus Methylocalor cossyra TaxID=3108543 RepID=A0ABP1C6R3_9GAMM